MDEFFTENIVLLFWSAVQAGQVKFFKTNFYIIYPEFALCKLTLHWGQCGVLTHILPLMCTEDEDFSILLDALEGKKQELTKLLICF